ncbi:cell division protein FtsQ/DivIB [Tessaracoccus antarcticus]|uniref:FtsQ-type POTRA domain-containing protein n=1 Tax=Tessaracoccus antarcticus TaxID=2479848 RepID=A0A3M0G6H2_9ACTN|nr:FtsQ-type POTRA domain-containing protein [Tessaracoccus antarcticus]RMB59697.1 FtsQ-type POTRA domain-containing protein [Tessaracoccus antarcticus]
MSTTSPGEFAAALQEKKLRDRRRQLIRWGVGAGTLLLAAFLVWLLGFSPAFRVHSVTVSGTSLLRVDDVTAAAVVPMDTPILALDTGAIAARVRKLPAVRSVEVTRDLPTTVAISVVERAVAYQRVEGESFESVDADGVVFATSSSRSKGAMLAVTAGKDTRLLRDVATVVSHIPLALLPNVEKVQAQAVDRITLQLDDGDLVVWGSAEQSQLKADVLLALRLQVEDATLYDVSAPSYPTTK